MKILLDSDFLFALYIEKDPLHKRAVDFYKWHETDKFTILNITKQECATVLSKKIKHSVALKFIEDLDQFGADIIELNSYLETLTWNIFLMQTKKGTSFVDCANLAALKEYNLDRIASFDRFYPKEIRII